jgi:ABC-type nitrate/sulfonate/bicarbonate transport system substrate-binding protein
MESRRLYDWGVLALVIGVIVGTLAVRLRGQQNTAAADDDKLVFGLPGIPPVYGAVVAYVAEGAGFYKKFGVNVELRPYDSGTVAAQALAKRENDISLSPTGIVMRLAANDGADLVGIYGLENPDWIVGSLDPSKSRCEDLAGQSVGVDATNGGRSIVLDQVLRSCKLGLADVQQVAAGTAVDQAMIAGKVKIGVLHLDDVPSTERATGKKLIILARLAQVNPDTHYLMLTVQRETLMKRRDVLVRMVAAHIAATAYMRDPANADRVADMAKPTGRSHDDAKESLRRYNEMEYWPFGHDGLNRRKMDKDAALQVSTGGIKKDKAPVPYEKLTDLTVYQDAAALARAR